MNLWDKHLQNKRGHIHTGWSALLYAKGTKWTSLTLTNKKKVKLKPKYLNTKHKSNTISTRGRRISTSLYYPEVKLKYPRYDCRHLAYLEPESAVIGGWNWGGKVPVDKLAQPICEPNFLEKMYIPT